jgi:hypothetical protein
VVSHLVIRITRIARHSLQVLVMLILGHAAGASAGLFDRGNRLIYDDVLNITWVQDASLCVTLGNCINRNDNFMVGGMAWVDANTWAGNLVYQGFDDWRLPYASVAAGAGPTTTLLTPFACTGAGGADEVACRDNEMAYMFYYNLDGNPFDNKSGTQTSVDRITFINIEPGYWSGTEFNSVAAWNFFLNGGSQVPTDKVNPLAAWAVRSGDVAAAAVSEPPSELLFGIGALALLWAGIRRWR